MTEKTYPIEITNEINQISTALNQLFNSSKTNLRTVSKFSGLSVNSVKSVLTGKTANIASYSSIAKALGTNLIDLIYQIKVNELKNASPVEENSLTAT